MRPYIVKEPITGLRWVATSTSSALLAWLPLFCVTLALLVGFAVGYFY